jgi:hypothetical protein
VRRWHAYWFAEGGRLSCAILRIAIAVALMWSLHRLRGGWPPAAPGSPVASGVYRPIGVWMLFGHHVPSNATISVLWVLAWAGAIGMLLGLASRLSALVAFVPSVALISLSFSAATSWSHGFNVVWLALLAFQGARGGDALSIDALVRRLRGLAPRDVPRGYQWSIRLVQLAVAIMFASGMWFKVVHGHWPTLRWALSDNLRHHLLVRYDLHGVPRSALASWLIDDVWRYRTAASLNLISQTMPLVACFLVRRPVLRAVCGGFFVVETIALGAVMLLWNPHWLPLAVVFVDWEALLAWLGRPVSHPVTPTGWRAPLAAHVFVAAFVAYDALTAFTPHHLDQRLGTYPFSAFPMFAEIRARKPFSKHLPYSVAGVEVELVMDHPAPDADRWLGYRYRKLARVHDPAEMARRVAGILAFARATFPAAKLRGVRVYLTIFEAPAYPAPARLDPHRVALIAEDLDGEIHTMLGHTHLAGGRLVVTPRPEHVEAPTSGLSVYLDDLPTAHVLATGPGPWTVAPVTGNPAYFVTTAGGRAWLIEATRAYFRRR